MANGILLKMNFPSDAQLGAMLGTIPKLEQLRVTDKVVEAGASVVVNRARALAPRSSATGTAKKRSANQLKEADWEYPLWKTIKRVTRKYGSTRGIAVVGPEWPRGNKAYFNTSPKGNKGHNWGYQGKEYSKKKGGIHKAGPAKARIQVRNWIVQAFDETKEQQLQAMKTKLKELTDQMMRS